MTSMSLAPSPAIPGAAPSAALGGLITERQMGGVARVVTITMLVVVILLCVGGAVVAVGGLMRGHWIALLGLCVALLIGWGCAWGIRNSFRHVAFHEGGMVDTVLSRRREVLYHEVDQLSYGITRQYVNGSYAGTNINLVLRTLDGRRVGWTGRYSEKLVGRGFFKAGRFEGSDPMDVVRGVISFHISTRMTEAMARGETVVWPGAATLSAAGLTPLRGRRKGQLVPWSQISGMSMDKGILRVFAHGDSKSFLDTMAAAANTFPCMEVVSSLIGGGEAVAVQPGAAAFDGDGASASAPGARVAAGIPGGGIPLGPDGMARKSSQYTG